MTEQIHPVILSGGMGTRLWPMSRISDPKQFQPVDGNGGRSFLQATVERHLGDGFAEPLMVASAASEDRIAAQLDEIGVPAQFIGEPEGRNTGPAVLAAALSLAETDPSSVMLVLPSDHVIKGEVSAPIAEMGETAREGWIVLFGIVPRSPETGFGYIVEGARVPGHGPACEVARFIEKPDHATALKMMADGGVYWSSGISMMRADVLIAEFERHDPETLEAVRGALCAARPTARGIVLDRASFADAANEPTEKLIFESSDRVCVSALDVDWNDVGAWTAIYSIGSKSEDGNVVSGEVMPVETRNSLLRGSGKLLTVIGMEDVIVVDTPDALLVTNHANAQKVKEAVGRLKSAERREVVEHAEQAAPARRDDESRNVTAHRVEPGKAMTLAAADDRRLVVTIAEGTARAVNGTGATTKAQGSIFEVKPGSSVHLSNAGPDRLVLIAVAVPGARAAGGSQTAIRRGGRASA